MIWLAEMGLITLIIVAVLSLLQASSLIVPLSGRAITTLSYSLFLVTLLAFIILARCFINDDFSLLYVAQHSNTQLPLGYKIAAVWAGHEGSLLLWLLFLTGWGAIFTFFQPQNSAKPLAIIAVVCASFTLFILFFSNPFIRLLPPMIEGRDLNPMLQDFALLIHPPLLYLGYAGLVIPFALGTTTGINGINHRACQIYSLICWFFLTLGITLGAWWAYHELGWGGWWFWDPVENVSLLPWLAVLALIHTLASGKLTNWHNLLAVLGFSFSLLATFVTRSGILMSVHAFALSPQYSVVLLLLSLLIVCLGLTGFYRQYQVNSAVVIKHWYSRQTIILISTILILLALFTVALGTFYPLLFRLNQWGTISIGSGYFNKTVIVPLLLGFFLSGFYWQKNRFTVLITLLAVGLICLCLINRYPFLLVVLANISLALWFLLSGLWRLSAFSLRRMSLYVIHSGIAVVAIAATISGYYSQELSVKLSTGDEIQWLNYTLHYQRTELLIGPNYTAEQAVIELKRHGKPPLMFYPERRYYPTRHITMNEPAIISDGYWADIYILLGEKMDASYYPLRLYYKPLINGIWSGTGITLLGCLLWLYGLSRRRKN